MAVRILHCGKSLASYGVCLKEQVLGFTNRSPQLGDTVYVVVRMGKRTCCGMRAKLADVTDARPWPNPDRYVASFTLDEVAYCQPFDVHFLSEVGGEFWALKYLQGAKPITDARALEGLRSAFDAARTDAPVLDDVTVSEPEPSEEEFDEELIEPRPEATPPAVVANLSVMGTFQTIRFKNESDKVQGLEPLVNRHFYALFPAYRADHSLLIPDNRLFLSAGLEARGDSFMKGIRSIPDALLVVFNKQHKHPLQINLIEYECFGENRISSQDKSNYLNSHVLPQLMRFASSFSIVTDKQIRDRTIKEWVTKIIGHIYASPDLESKLAGWIRQVDPTISGSLIGWRADQLLTAAFQNALKVTLVIDELSAEQKDTIANVISAFKLESGIGIEFLAYIVRLHQRIAVTDIDAEYALSVQ